MLMERQERDTDTIVAPLFKKSILETDTDSGITEAKNGGELHAVG